MQILSKLHFFNGFLFGFIAIWAVPRTQFDRLAIFYYDITTKETINEIDYSKNKEIK
jgi:hypothetical protein